MLSKRQRSQKVLNTHEDELIQTALNTHVSAHHCCGLKCRCETMRRFHTKPCLLVIVWPISNQTHMEDLTLTLMEDLTLTLMEDQSKYFTHKTTIEGELPDGGTL